MAKNQNSPKPGKFGPAISSKNVLLAGVIACVVVTVIVVLDSDQAEERALRFTQSGSVVNWWDPVPPQLRAASLHVGSKTEDADSSEQLSNIARADYSGPESCSKCHQKQYQAWSQHPHRWMNARANESTVKADFSDEKSILYLGGRATFFRVAGKYRMRLERGDIVRDYSVTQTIGSRFYQYYVGRLVDGPEPKSDIAYTVEHVLPFGYWLDRDEWVPTVHVHFAELDGKNVDEEDLPSAKRHDPFAAPHEKFSFTEYYQCSHCHTTMPIGDLLVRNPEVLGMHAPVSLHLDTSGYLEQTHPELPSPSAIRALDDKEAKQTLVYLLQAVKQWDARDHAVTLGVSCESCHLGAKDHAEGNQRRPYFFPESPHLFAYSDVHNGVWDSGRTHDNVNWACARCHAGGRRLLAGGMATWNSTEYTDATRGSCYSELRCVDCHDPHQATGAKWARTERQNDAVCFRCHQDLKNDEALRAHTHHEPGGAGSRCLDCHMPRVTEGLQDMVRTHAIFSPTQPEMIEANHPNACNMCHPQKPIDWTLKHLKQWFGREYSESAIAVNYPNRKGPTALSWLRSPDQSVRVIAADVLTRTRSNWALPHLVDSLDDPFVINRQFGRINLEQFIDIRLADFGYRFYMTRGERAAPIAAIRAEVARRAKRSTFGPREGPTPP